MKGDCAGLSVIMSFPRFIIAYCSIKLNNQVSILVLSFAFATSFLSSLPTSYAMPSSPAMQAHLRCLLTLLLHFFRSKLVPPIFHCSPTPRNIHTAGSTGTMVFTTAHWAALVLSPSLITLTIQPSWSDTLIA